MKHPNAGRQAYKGCCDLCNISSTSRWYRKVFPDKVICKSCYDKHRRKDDAYRQLRNSHNKEWNRTYKGAEKCSNDKGMDFPITKEEWESKVKECNYCGKDISENTGTKLDRVDNSKGYTNENTVGCCRQCNVAKNNHSLGDFEDWIKRVYERLTK